MRSRLIVLPLFASLVVAGCDVSDSGSTSTTAEPTPAPETTPAPAEEKLPWTVGDLPVTGAEITASPNPASFCDAETAPVEVRWDVVAANPTTLQLWLEDPSGARKLWIAPSGRQGTKMTGAWMREGSRIIAVDASTSRVLDIVRITAAPCAD